MHFCAVVSGKSESKALVVPKIERSLIRWSPGLGVVKDGEHIIGSEPGPRHSLSPRLRGGWYGRAQNWEGSCMSEPKLRGGSRVRNFWSMILR